MEQKPYQPEKQLVRLVAQAVEDIAKEKGWKSYPDEVEVRIVLTALLIVQEAIRRVRHGQAKPK